MITGLGCVSPLGNTVEDSWRGLLAGESGAAEITQFDHTDYKIHFACEAKDFDPTNWIDRKEARRMDRFVHLILAAAYQAQEDAKLDIHAEADDIGASPSIADSLARRPGMFKTQGEVRGAIEWPRADIWLLGLPPKRGVTRK